MTRRTRQSRQPGRYAGQRRRMSRTRLMAITSAATAASVVGLATACAPDEPTSERPTYPATDVMGDLPPCQWEDSDAAGIPLDDDLDDYPGVDQYAPCQWDSDLRGNGDGRDYVVDIDGHIAYVD